MARCSITSSVRLVYTVIVACLCLQQCEYPAPQAPSGPSLPSSTPVVVNPYVGSAAPDFATKSVIGEAVRLSDLRGKVVLLAFFGTSS
jgi:cytochrome oxidase Cu insertion factor (SCO1/SenC/PrrC family)